MAKTIKANGNAVPKPTPIEASPTLLISWPKRNPANATPTKFAIRAAHPIFNCNGRFLKRKMLAMAIAPATANSTNKAVLSPEVKLASPANSTEP